MADLDDFGASEPQSIARKRIDDKKIKIARNNQMFRSAFSSPNGKQVLQDLVDRFYKVSSIVPGDSYATHAREGAREVVIYILDRIERAEKNHEGLDVTIAG